MWEHISTLQSLWKHILRFNDKRRSLILDHFIEGFFDFGIAGRCFGDNKVQEDDACDNDGEEPHDPINPVQFRNKIVGAFKVVVTHGDSEGLKDISDKKTDVLVFLTKIVTLFNIIIASKALLQIEVSDAQNVNEERK